MDEDILRDVFDGEYIGMYIEQPESEEYQNALHEIEKILQSIKTICGNDDVYKNIKKVLEKWVEQQNVLTSEEMYEQFVKGVKFGFEISKVTKGK